MHKFGVALIVCVLTASLAGATSVAVDGTDLVGSRTTNAGGGLVGGGGWGDDEGFKIAWDISFDNIEQVWDYEYTMTALDGTDLKKAIDHVLLEVSDSITAANYQSILFEGNPALSAPQTWLPDGTKGDNDLPGNIYAVRLEGGDGAYFSFESTDAPMWGSLYVKDGPGNGVAKTAWNEGFGTYPLADGPFTNWIPVPDPPSVSDPVQDDQTAVPEPATLTLLGLGLAGVMARRKGRKV